MSKQPKHQSNGQERRRFSRVPFEAMAVLTHPGGRSHARLLDISLKGVLLTLPDDWRGRIGDKLTVDLMIDEGAVIIYMQTEVAHVEPDRLGLHCLHIDLESIAHLRRLIELNLGDPEKLNRELQGLGIPD